MNDENKNDCQPQEEKKASIVIEETMIPIRSPEVTIREEMEEDGKYMLFNAENELILVINSTGRFILDNCDGEKNVAQLVEAIEKKYIINDGINMLVIVKSYIGTLLAAKLIRIKEEER